MSASQVWSEKNGPAAFSKFQAFYHRDRSHRPAFKIGGMAWHWDRNFLTRKP